MFPLFIEKWKPKTEFDVIIQFDIYTNMSVDPLYITPHETALAVIATSMKKSRLSLQTLVINSIIGAVLFSAGGMLYCVAKANNPSLKADNPGILSLIGGINYSIGLFYVIINGCDLFNSNILFFTVGFLRGAVSIFDLAVSWTVSWICNLGGSLFVAYVICYLSGAMDEEFLKVGTRDIAENKLSLSFVQTLIRGIGGNFCVCLAVYLQLMSKPIHVKFISILLPIYTFVACGFTHVVADMYLVPMGMLNGANVSVGEAIWKNLIPGTVGNIIGGCFFAIIVPFYLHLFVVEEDRKQLDLPQYDAIDEQPEVNVDSRVVRIDTKELNPEKESINPPGVFPVKGMKPLLREKSIMNRDFAEEKNSDEESSVHDYYPIDYRGENDSDIDSLDLENQELGSRKQVLKKVKTREQQDEEQFDRSGRYNPQKNRLGSRLERALTTRKGSQGSVSLLHGVNQGIVTTTSMPVTSTNQGVLPRFVNSSQQYDSSSPSPRPVLQHSDSGVSSLTSSRNSLSTKADFKRQLKRQNVTNKALMMADPVAGSVDLDDSFVRKPSRLRYSQSFKKQKSTDSESTEEN